MNDVFRTWLIDARGRAGLTQKQLADETGLHVNTIKNIESGETTRVSAGVAAKLRSRLAGDTEAHPELVRSEFDRHTQALLDLIGADLMRRPEPERLDRIFEIGRYVLNLRDKK